MPYKFKPGLVTVSQSGKAVKLDGLAVPSSSDVTKEYVDQQDAETIASAKGYTDAELARAVETQVAKDTQQDAEISGKQPKGDYATSTKLTQAVEAQAKKDAAQDNAISELDSKKADKAQYELIEKVTFDIAAPLDKTVEPDGTPYNFDAVKIVTNIPGKTSSVGFLYAGIPNNIVAQLVYKGGGIGFMEVVNNGGYWDTRGAIPSSDNGFNALMINAARLQMESALSDYPTLNRIRFISKIPEKSVFKIYAVRHKEAVANV